mmetsp:Transcript_51367/g.111749  ORF Transcript_51367/g.111749 Transcript_51367/m.111749 type:complete len:213 (+) Transcript_51367:1149-1787(+)
MDVQLEQQLGAEGDAQHGEVARRDGLPDEHGRRRKREVLCAGRGRDVGGHPLVHLAELVLAGEPSVRPPERDGDDAALFVENLEALCRAHQPLYPVHPHALARLRALALDGADAFDHWERRVPAHEEAGVGLGRQLPPPVRQERGHVVGGDEVAQPDGQRRRRLGVGSHLCDERRRDGHGAGKGRALEKLGAGEEYARAAAHVGRNLVQRPA